MRGCTIELNDDEALVLFEFLARVTEHERPALFADPAEEHVLWMLEGQLEKKLVVLLSPDYARNLHEARRRVSGAG
jgi:hypothetical protein